MMSALDQLLDFARDVFDPEAEPIAVHTGVATSLVLRAASWHGPVIVKGYRSADHHCREVYAYRHWTGVLGERAAQLLASKDDPPMVILSALPGRPAALLNLTVAHQRDLHAQAGSLLRALHLVEPPRHDTDIIGWLCERGERRLAVASSVFRPEECAAFRKHLRALANLGPLPAVPCHLDFAPRNLLRDENGTVRVIDFEHSRHDLPARDLVRLADRTWKRRPDLRSAFLETYGPLSDLDRAVIEHATHLDHLTAAVPLTMGGILPAMDRDPARGLTPHRPYTRQETVSVTEPG
jgi:Ser/Thr protein kinase RdoA (MazF antagonist)